MLFLFIWILAEFLAQVVSHVSLLLTDSLGCFFVILNHVTSLDTPAGFCQAFLSQVFQKVLLTLNLQQGFI